MPAPQGNGGACYGDSGGPDFATVDGRFTLVATNVTYRLDTPAARTFLAPFVALP
ncbi:hypothetical protein [Kitasatospora sp. McL0602]|uniref:hypothetical protein n=1 Tax=Kitasatospora sp. McL0602 TaxID=3439530 RepID=UPI003F8B38B4